jgi:uncharacterized protein YjiS (DUF1127 family)
MSATHSTMIHLATNGLRALARSLGARLDRLVRYFVYRAAIAHLRELDDWALHDIGLARSQIEPAVHGLTNPKASSAALYAATREATPWS